MVKRSIIRSSGGDGIYVSGSAQLTVGNLNEYSCGLYENAGYDFYNNTSNTQFAKYNYWGFTDSALIASRIYDHQDSPGLGAVHFVPFATQIEFNLPAAGQVRLEIFNVLGQQVKTLVDGVMEAGHHAVSWDATDNSGNAVSSGVYFYRMVSGDQADRKKMLLLR